MKYEYFIQKHDISPQSLGKFKNGYDEGDGTLKAQIDGMGVLGWELCGIIQHPSDANNAKFIYKRAMEEPTPMAKANLDFGQALELLKEGHTVSREGWRADNMYLVLATSNPSNKIDIPLSLILFKTTNDTLEPWKAGQDDILTDDWCVRD